MTGTRTYWLLVGLSLVAMSAGAVVAFYAVIFMCLLCEVVPLEVVGLGVAVGGIIAVLIYAVLVRIAGKPWPHPVVLLITFVVCWVFILGMARLAATTALGGYTAMALGFFGSWLIACLCAVLDPLTRQDVRT